jgi:hypothetical protein
MDDNKYTLNDLVFSAISQKPEEFSQAFNDLMIDRLQSAVEDRKQEIAQYIFNPVEDQPDSFEDENEPFEDEPEYEAEKESLETEE